MTLAAFAAPAAVTLAIALLLFGCALRVGRMRMRHRIDAPATTGHPDLEIALRVQMNTLENAVLVLPPLWMRLRLCPLRWVVLWALTGTGLWCRR
jgi:hypothetical protein